VSDDANARAAATAAASGFWVVKLGCGPLVTGPREMDVEALVASANVGWAALAQPTSISTVTVMTARIQPNG